MVFRGLIPPRFNTCGVRLTRINGFFRGRGKLFLTRPSLCSYLVTRPFVNFDPIKSSGNTSRCSFMIQVFKVTSVSETSSIRAKSYSMQLLAFYTPLHHIRCPVDVQSTCGFAQLSLVISMWLVSVEQPSFFR